MRRAFMLALGAFLVSFCALLPNSSAQAYTWQQFYTGGGGKWPSYTNVYYLIRQGWPSTTHYNRIEDGSAQWNAVGGSTGIEPDLLYNGSTTVTGNADSPCSATYNGIYWRNLDYLGTDTLGFTPHCENSSGVVTRFSMSIDNRTWYTGTGTATNYDLWSIATHEFGHATGWYGHFTSSDSICANNENQATMCPGYYPNSVRWRTLDATSKSMFQGAY